MASTSGDSFGLWHQRQQQEEDEEASVAGEEDELEKRVDKDRTPDVGENGLVESIGQWDLSSSQEILEDVGLLEELEDYRDLLGEGEPSSDLCELPDVERAGEASPESPPLGDGDHLEDDRSPGDKGLASYWHLRRQQQWAMREGDQDRVSSENLKAQEEAWDTGSGGEAFLELSYECQYGSEYSTSPEALGDPLASYKCSKSYSFASDGEEDLSEGSNVIPPPPKTPLGRTLLKRESLDAQESLEFPDRMELSSPSGRSLESHPCSSPAGSACWSLLGRLSLEELRDSPGIDAETFPEPSCLDKPVGAIGKTASVAGTTRVKPKERLFGAVEATGVLRAFKRVGAQPLERARKLKADVPHGLPSKFSRQSRSLSPRGRVFQRKTDRPNSTEPAQAGKPTPVTSDALPYGRGQLNYPLPDLSKVEPRVRFPKDPQSYHPPRGKTLPARSKEPGRPVVFKSPAEIVREVLLSSGEGSPHKCPTPTVSVIPEELKSPRQATELVHQLQEDYHKLLTKYAEAENTIDRLRLGAKVRLYSDPPKPSHGFQMGTLSQGSKVMTFSIPQMMVADVTGASGPAPEAAWREGSSGQATISPLANCTGAGVPKADRHTSTDSLFSGDLLTRALATRARKLQTEVEFLEEAIRTGRLTPLDQLKGFAKLKEAQGTLERAYLQAREKCRRTQNPQEPAGAPGDFDPDREAEGAIFRLEMRLEELKEMMDRVVQIQPAQQLRDGHDSALQSNCEAGVSADSLPPQASVAQMRSPTPSVQAPIPAIRTPYPEAPIPKDSCCQGRVGIEVSSASDETEDDAEDLPEPLWHKQLQVEKNFDHLLDHYSSFKSLPEAMSLEQLDLDEQNSSPEEVDGAATGNAGATDNPCGMGPKGNETTRITSLQQAQETEPPERPRRKRQQPPYQTSHAPPIPAAESVLQGAAEKSRPSAMAPFGKQQEPLSPLASAAGSALSESVNAQKPVRKTSAALPEELRIVSPETDSGFVGSEASRVSPLGQMPKHRSSHFRSRGMLGKSTPTAGAGPSATVRPASPTREPSGMESLSRHPPAEGSAWRRGQSEGRPFQIASPPRWTASMASEEEADMESDSEEHNGLCAYKSPPSELRCSPSSSAASLSPARAACYELVGSRLERDQAIVALQKEVSKLRQGLEETLNQPHGSPKRLSSPRASRTQMPAPGRVRSLKSASLQGKASGERWAESEAPGPVIEPGKRTEGALRSQHRTHLDLAPSESDCPSLKPREEKCQEGSSSKTKPPKQPMVRGPYTGACYSFATHESQDLKARVESASCPHCQDVRSQPGEESSPEQGARETESNGSPRDSFRPSERNTQRKVEPCLLCKGIWTPRSKVTHVEEHSTEKTSMPQKSSPDQQGLHHPGLWYLTVPAPAASLSYIPTIPLTPCHPSPVVYCYPLTPTSASTPAALPALASTAQRGTELRSWASPHRPHGGHCFSLTLDRDGLRELNRSLSRALEAANGMKLSTKRMSRSLASELSQVRSLRGSCLF